MTWNIDIHWMKCWTVTADAIMAHIWQVFFKDKKAWEMGDQFSHFFKLSFYCYDNSFFLSLAVPEMQGCVSHEV